MIRLLQPPTGAALPARVYEIALQRAVALLGGNDRKKLDALLASGQDLPLGDVDVTIRRFPSDEEMGVALAAELARRISQQLAKLAEPTSTELAVTVEVTDALARKGGPWARLASGLAGLPGVRQYRARRQAKRAALEAEAKAVLAGIEARFDKLVAAHGITKAQFEQLYQHDVKLAELLLAGALTGEARAHVQPLGERPKREQVEQVYREWGPLVLEQLGVEAKLPSGWQRSYGYRFATHITDKESAAKILTSGKMLPQKWGIISGALPQLVETFMRGDLHNLVDNITNKTRAWVFASDERLGWKDITRWDAARSSIIRREVASEGKRKGWTGRQMEALAAALTKGLKSANTAVSVMVPASQLQRPADWKAADLGGHEAATMLGGVNLFGTRGSVRNLSDKETQRLRDFLTYKGTVSDKLFDRAMIGGGVASAAALTAMFGPAGAAVVLGGTALGFAGVFAGAPRLLNWVAKKTLGLDKKKGPPALPPPKA